MSIGASLFLIALGAILKFAVTHQVNGIDVNNVGMILMIVGVVGLALSLILLSARRRTDIVHHDERAVVAPGERTAVVEPSVRRTTVVEPVDPIDRGI